MRKDMLRQTLRAIRAAGYEPEIQQRRHLHIIWLDSDGRKHRVVLSRSPVRPQRSNKNRAVLRRLLENRT